ncbi:tRNA dihydrouridine synthase A [Edhazardia aedis USNM 41457]|uniref:tRNA dihydrouridine synthase A n=1 Tax=Edhazardia aedis (strain USNM 41457) TaxID=1003232 RepID=J9DHS4_EDHAE|nr:tRNA dihydrouridine synthase A [Edhazardia aedis USNM 41457]|eukprot:EJW02165.1 tRNA dihydrouridine synthase A [Edhazardia aedis USNM 41457]
MVEISLAPMLDVTTANFRHLIHLISPETILFTEMIVDSTIIHVGIDKLKDRLGKPNSKTVVQLGGSDPEKLAKSVVIVSSLGFTNFNLNCGCPSSKVQHGCFGAILMKNAKLVSKIINRIEEITGIVISIKCRIGVDEFEDFEFFDGFINEIYCNTKCRKFYIHARKCLLNGLSPHKNRTIPPLKYNFVYNIKRKYMDAEFYLNGGIKDPIQIDTHLSNLDGFMIGRQAMNDPFVFKKFHKYLSNKNDSSSSNECDINSSEISLQERKETIMKYLKSFGSSIIISNSHTKPINNMLFGLRGNKTYKQQLNKLVQSKATIEDSLADLQSNFEEIDQLYKHKN